MYFKYFKPYVSLNERQDLIFTIPYNCVFFYYYYFYYHHNYYYTIYMVDIPTSVGRLSLCCFTKQWEFPCAIVRRLRRESVQPVAIGRRPGRGGARMRCLIFLAGDVRALLPTQRERRCCRRAACLPILCPSTTTTRARRNAHAAAAVASIRAHAHASVFVRQSLYTDTVVDRVRTYSSFQYQSGRLSCLCIYIL